MRPLIIPLDKTDKMGSQVHTEISLAQPSRHPVSATILLCSGTGNAVPNPAPIVYMSCTAFHVNAHIEKSVSREMQGGVRMRLPNGFLSEFVG